MTSFLEIFFALLSFIWGSVWGSFLNVVVYRVPRGESVVSPPSHCPHCNTGIKAHHNIPLISYIALGGKCANSECRKPISIRYPLIELVTGAMALAIWLFTAYHPLVPNVGLALAIFAFRFTLIAALIAITFIDLEYMIIPLVLSLPVFILGFVYSWLFGEYSSITLLDSLIAAGIGGGTVAAIVLFWQFVLKREGMGWGDAVLLGLLGAWLGTASLPFILLAGSLQGIIYAGGLMAFGRLRGDVLRQAVPFGPFLALAGMEWLFFSNDLLTVFRQVFNLD